MLPEPLCHYDSVVRNDTAPLGAPVVTRPGCDRVPVTRFSGQNSADRRWNFRQLRGINGFKGLSLQISACLILNRISAQMGDQLASPLAFGLA